MKLVKLIAIPAVSMTLAACGSDFEWFPKTTDSTPPVITATVSGNRLFDNRTTHFTSPPTVTFAANEPATVYYTTGGEPTTSSPSVEITSATGVAGPTITLTDTILKFFGIDKSAKKNRSATQTHYFKSP